MGHLARGAIFIGFFLILLSLLSCRNSDVHLPMITKFQAVEFSLEDQSYYFQWDSKYADQAVLVEYGLGAVETSIPPAGEKKMRWFVHDETYTLKVFNNYGSTKQDLVVKGFENK
jgi:hypothetical protein